MSNEVALSSNTDLAFLEAVETAAQAAGITGHTYLAFSGKTGQYEHKNDDGTDEKVQIKTPFTAYINLPEVSHGHVAWVNSERVDSRMYRLFERPKLETDAELPDVLANHPDPSKIDKRDGWSKTVIFPLLDPSTGKEYLFTVSNKSGVRKAMELLAKIGADMRQGKSPSTHVPMIKFGKGSFPAKDDNGKDIKVPFPTMVIDKWVARDEIEFSPPPAPTSSTVAIEGEAASSAITGPKEAAKSKFTN